MPDEPAQPSVRLGSPASVPTHTKPRIGSQQAYADTHTYSAEARPIFVIGRHRSGTTWLSNILGCIPEVYVPAHPFHRGVHETAFFSHLVRYCNQGRTTSDLLAIKYLFEQSDLALLIGLQADFDIIKHGYPNYFRMIMDAAARRNGARYWLEKTPAHTLHARSLARWFPDAIFVAVIRNHLDVVASNVYRFGESRSVWSWFRHAAVTTIYEKIAKAHATIAVSYEDLRDAHDGTILGLFRRLGISADTVPRSPFDRNTSYRDTVPRHVWWQTLVAYTARGLVWMWPTRIVEAIVARWRKRRIASLPDWFFLIRSGQRQISKSAQLE